MIKNKINSKIMYSQYRRSKLRSIGTIIFFFLLSVFIIWRSFFLDVSLFEIVVSVALCILFLFLTYKSLTDIRREWQSADDFFRQHADQLEIELMKETTQCYRSGNTVCLGDNYVIIAKSSSVITDKLFLEVENMKSGSIERRRRKGQGVYYSIHLSSKRKGEDITFEIRRLAVAREIIIAIIQKYKILIVDLSHLLSDDFMIKNESKLVEVRNEELLNPKKNSWVWNLIIIAVCVFAFGPILYWLFSAILILIKMD